MWSMVSAGLLKNWQLTNKIKIWEKLLLMGMLLDEYIFFFLEAENLWFIHPQIATFWNEAADWFK